jgi:hypothetical protein
MFLGYLGGTWMNLRYLAHTNLVLVHHLKYLLIVSLSF